MIEQFLRVFLIVGQIVHACGYDSNGVWDKLLWPAALSTMATHVSHLTVHTVSQPLSESRFGFIKVDITDAELLEAEFCAPPKDVLFQGGEVFGGF